MFDLKKNKKKIIAAVLLAVVFSFSLFGCKKSGDDNLAENKATVEVQNQIKEEKEEAANKPENQEKSPEESRKEQTQNTPLTEKKAENASENQEQKKGEAENKIFEEKPEEKKAAEQKAEELYCTLSVSCSTALKNISKLSPEKREIIPENGVIFAEKKVVFYEGESVFNVLSREMKQNKIHMEFENTPVYQSAYIEGIANLYEFDCGELSGWMYSVNGSFPSYGCSRYKLKAGDRVEWIYTCDLGADIGGEASAGNGR